MRAPPADLGEALRLIVITDRRLAAPRSVEVVVEAALRAGARAVQLRDKEVGAGVLLEEARRLRALTRKWGALLFVNDRLDVALAAGADGVHLGADDLPVAAARRVAPPGFLIGFSADDPRVAREAARAGAAYIGCGTVFPTSSKGDAGEVIGTERLDEVARAVSIPVVGIGGIDPDRAPAVAATAAAGVAVIRAVMAAPDPEAAVRDLLRPFLEREATG